MILNTLYKLDQKGRIRQWTIMHDDISYTVYHGLSDGKQIEKTTKVKAKNIGKANETSLPEQAKKEAEALWLKQRDRECYLEDLEDEPHHIEPMLALDYSRVPHRVDWDDTIFGQAKLDGVRAIYDSYKDPNVLQSRKGIDYPLIKLANKLLFVQNQLGINYPIDGEIYLHGQTLNRIHGAAVSPKELTDSLDFYIFDIVAPGIPYSMRRKLLESIDTSMLPLNIKILTSFEITEDRVQQEHDRIVTAGFEGIMLKGGSGEYELGFRSPHLFKYKNFKEKEFEIIDVIPDKEGQGILVYKIIHPDNSICDFKSRMRGTNEERVELLENKHNYIGKQGTVRFFSYTEYGIPQFPVTVAINQDK